MLKKQLNDDFNEDTIVTWIAYLGHDAYALYLVEQPILNIIKILNKEKKYETRIVILGYELIIYDVDSSEKKPVLISADGELIALCCPPALRGDSLYGGHQIHLTAHIINATPHIIDDNIKFYYVTKRVYEDDTKFIVKKEHVIKYDDKYYMKMEDYLKYNFTNAQYIKDFFSNPLYSKF